MSIVNCGDTVQLHYTSYSADGCVIETSGQREPFEFVAGGPDVIVGVSRAVIGMRVGERRRIAVPPEQAFGYRGSSSTVIGDIYTNGDITLGNSQDYIGSIYARGNVYTGANQKITGNVYANGNISLGSNSTSVYGSAFAIGNIATGGTIRDTAQAGGTIGCAKVLGACIPNSPPPPVPVQHLPEFAWNPANYAAVSTYATGAAFVSTHSKVNMQGTFYVTGDVSFAKQDSLWLTGDVTIVATGNISLPGAVVNNAASAAKVQLTVISSGGGTITPANNFTIPSTVSTLLYTTGTFDARNSSTFRGVLYAGGVTSGAHISVTHELLTAPGFNWAPASPQAFTIRNISTRETSGG